LGRPFAHSNGVSNTASVCTFRCGERRKLIVDNRCHHQRIENFYPTPSWGTGDRPTPKLRNQALFRSFRVWPELLVTNHGNDLIFLHAASLQSPCGSRPCRSNRSPPARTQSQRKTQRRSR